MKKAIGVLLLAVLLAGCGVAPEPSAPETTETAVLTEPTEATEATQATEPLSWDVTGEEVTGSLRIGTAQEDLTGLFTDGDRDTRQMLGASLIIESDRPFSALYLEWDAMPGPFTVRWDTGEIPAGTEGFQHDYIRLPQAVTRAELAWESHREPVLCELRAFTEGGAPADVQDWHQPEGEADILVFPTHSDDDALFFGALMSYYAIDRELQVQTAFMTRHYAEPERNHERLDGLWEVGIRRYPVLSDAPDLFAESLEEARFLYAPYDILGWQIRQIRRFKPQVIVGHDLDGEYGHGGHMLNAHTLARAVELAADSAVCRDSAADYGLWDTPKLYFHLFPKNQIAVDVDRVLEKDPRGRTPFQVAEDAYSHHKSQHWCDFAVTRDDPLENCVYFGLYRSMAGPDTGGDIMENIEPR